jgi:8-oxo-dGTP pyrophosphatase MutT (NUDIX family)
MKSRNEVSAGGVVYRRADHGVEILICKDGGYHRWVLPKGLIATGEAPEQTAVREVAEEVGVQARVVAPLGDPEKYVYRARGVLVFKSVYYFLMEYESGSEAEHDREMEEVRWAPIEQAIELLHYKAAKEVVSRAKAVLDDPHQQERSKQT